MYESIYMMGAMKKNVQERFQRVFVQITTNRFIQMYWSQGIVQDGLVVGYGFKVLVCLSVTKMNMYFDIQQYQN